MPIKPETAAELLKQLKSLLALADWLGCPAGYSWKDISEQYIQGAEAVVKQAEEESMDVTF